MLAFFTMDTYISPPPSTSDIMRTPSYHTCLIVLFYTQVKMINGKALNEQNKKISICMIRPVRSLFIVDSSSHGVQRVFSSIGLRTNKWVEILIISSQSPCLPFQFTAWLTLNIVFAWSLMLFLCVGKGKAVLNSCRQNYFLEIVKDSTSCFQACIPVEDNVWWNVFPFALNALRSLLFLTYISDGEK